MTQRGTYILTAISIGVFILLTWIFADGLFSLGDLWVSDAIADSTILTYLFIVLIALAGFQQARSMPEKGVETKLTPDEAAGQTNDPTIWKLVMGNVYFALFWLPIRFFVGREWLSAGEHKVRDSAWMDGGVALEGYWQRVVTIPEQGRPPITYAWYRDFIQYMLDNGWYTWFAKIVAVGEVLVGLAIIVGALVGIAAFFGTFMNFSFMLAGTASSNPVLFGLSVFLILAWKVAGYWGLDRYLLPILGAPWDPGALFSSQRQEQAPSPA